MGTRWGVLVFFLEWEPTFRMLKANPVESPAFYHRTGGGGWVWDAGLLVGDAENL